MCLRQRDSGSCFSVGVIFGGVTVFSVPQMILARRGLGGSEGVNFLIGLDLGWGLKIGAHRIVCLCCRIGRSDRGDLTGVGFFIVVVGGILCSFPERLAKGDWVGAAGRLWGSGKEGV